MRPFQTLVLIGALWMALASLLAADPLPTSVEASPVHNAVDPASDGVGFDKVIDPAVGFFESPWIAQRLENRQTLANKSFDHVFTLIHDVPFGDGRTLRVYEHFTLDSWFRWPHRAVLMASSFFASGWNIPVDGYNAGEILAREGFFAFSVDLVGYGDSFKPENGNDATFELQLEALRTAIRYIRFFRLVPRVDILGEGYGSSLATQLADDPGRVRSVALTDNLYRVQIGGPNDDPVFREFLLNDPDGYVFIPPEVVSLFLVDSPPEVADYFAATQSGFLPVASFTVAFELPFYDPSVAKVPGLVLQAENDLVSPPSDAADLAADYGTDGAELVILEGAMRGPRFGSPTSATAYWQTVLEFLDP